MEENKSLWTTTSRSWIASGCLAMSTLLMVLPAHLKAIDYISSTNMVWLQGVEPIVTSTGFLNDGILRLETVDDSYTVTLEVNGTITNSPSGLVEVNLGAGGLRNLSSDWLNLGTFNINYGLNFSRDNILFDQRGAVYVGLYSEGMCDGLGGVFSQNDGTIVADGKLRLKNLTFRYNGGSIEGTPHLVSSELFIGPGAVPATFIFNGPASGLSSSVPAGYSLLVQGDDLEGDSVVTCDTGFSNAGEIVLESTNNPTMAAVVVRSGFITNLSSGSITINAGVGGNRPISADVLNQGSIVVNSPGNFSKTAGLFFQEGTMTVSPGQIAYVYGAGQTFEQRAGVVRLDGQLALNGARFRYLGGQIQGVPILYNSSLEFGGNATNAAAFYQSGPNSRLLSRIPKTGTVLVLGSSTAGAAIVASSGGFENQGSIRLLAIDNSWECGFNLAAGTLTNAPGASFSSETGTGGKRSVKGNLLNQGRLRVQAATPMAISGEFNQTASGVLEVDLNVPSSGSPAPVMVASNKVVLDGELKVTLPSGFRATSSIQFPLVVAPSLSGSFQQVTLPPVPNGFTWTVFYSPTAAMLNLVSPGSGTVLELELTETQAIIEFQSPEDGTYALLASTNLTSWIAIQTNQAPSGTVQMIDSNYRQFKQRFYRVIPLP